MPNKRHKSKGISQSSDGRSVQRCEVCGAMRDMWGFKPFTHWLLNDQVVKWCPGSKP